MAHRWRERGGEGEREREKERERARYPRISQPATPQMKHTWVVLDLARIIPHPRLSSTHRANTATHVEQTHTRATLCTRPMKRYMSVRKRWLEIFARFDCSRKKESRISSLGKNYSCRMCSIPEILRNIYCGF